MTSDERGNSMVERYTFTSRWSLQTKLVGTGGPALKYQQIQWNEVSIVIYYYTRQIKRKEKYSDKLLTGEPGVSETS